MTKNIIFFNQDNGKVWKICTICGLAKENNSFYNKDNRCKTCKIAYNKERRHIKTQQLKDYKKKMDKNYELKDKLINIYENRIQYLEKEIKYINREAIIND
jgi:hypothetical protein